MSDERATSKVLAAILGKAHAKLAGARLAFDEGFYDDAVSRAYYAAFHAVTALLAEQGLSFSSHAQTIGAFNRHFVKSGIFLPETTRRLYQLFEDRQRGDYDWRSSVDQDTALHDLEAAELLVASCEEHLRRRNEPPEVS